MFSYQYSFELVGLHIFFIVNIFPHFIIPTRTWIIYLKSKDKLTLNKQYIINTVILTGYKSPEKQSEHTWKYVGSIPENVSYHEDYLNMPFAVNSLRPIADSMHITIGCR